MTVKGDQLAHSSLFSVLGCLSKAHASWQNAACADSSGEDVVC